MNIKKINDILKEYKNNTHKKNAILIDGPWGCGKTYTVLNGLSKYKKTIYISLFGVESIDEINEKIYAKQHRIKYFFSRHKLHGTKLLKKIEKIREMYNDLTYSGEKNKYKNTKCDIVFDDLERVSDKIAFKDLLGYVDSLYLNNNNIICLIDSSRLKEKRLEDFQSYKEKTFDKHYYITDTVFLNLPNCPSFLKEDDLLDIFDLNLREAQKAFSVYNELILKFNIENDKKNKFSQNDIIKACVYAIKIIFCDINNEEINEKQSIFEYYKNKYGYLLAKNLLWFKSSNIYKEIENNSEFIELTISLCNYLVNLNDEDLRQNLLTKKSKDNILNVDLFYLSDMNKKYYYNAFNDYINNPNTIYTRQFTNIIRSLIADDDFEFSDNQLEKIAEIYSKANLPNRNLEILVSFHDSFDDPETKLKGKEISNRIINKMKANLENIDKETIKKLYENKNYFKHREELEKHDLTNQPLDEDSFQYIVDNDFLFPDLADDLEYDSWSYCHYIVSLCIKRKRTSELYNYFKKTLDENHSKCLVDRIVALIKYNIDKNISKSSLSVFLSNKLSFLNK